MSADRIDQAARVIAVDCKAVEVAGHLYVEAPKNRKRRKTIYPRQAPGGYPWPSGRRPGSRKPALSRRTELTLAVCFSLPEGGVLAVV